jgi:hypothetical protein
VPAERDDVRRQLGHGVIAQAICPELAEVAKLVANRARGDAGAYALLHRVRRAGGRGQPVEQRRQGRLLVAGQAGEGRAMVGRDPGEQGGFALGDRERLAAFEQALHGGLQALRVDPQDLDLAVGRHRGVVRSNVGEECQKFMNIGDPEPERDDGPGDIDVCTHDIVIDGHHTDRIGLEQDGSQPARSRELERQPSTIRKEIAGAVVRLAEAEDLTVAERASE